ncbi:hypothetical protein QBC34DRAFT_427571 [Podospora aff. communis PSN243]|uniref:Secreted protein n=1 Tax=Podospora aff. communis PSN243 TaxID=3040156 RepID=A0AAV9GGK0_9PEZI|nr:hypothetical protein QBC34DRAFT_427571 [Podospora aff. communis PSN243]
MYPSHLLVLGLGFLAQLVACIPADITDVPIDTVEISDGRKLPVANTLLWEGPAFADGPNVTLSGAPESIYKQLLDINPKYDAWDMPGHAERAAELGFTRNGTTLNPARALDKRQWGEVICGFSFFDAYWVPHCEANFNYLRILGGSCYAVPLACTRVSPCNECAFYFCDKDMAYIHATCGGITSYSSNGRRVFGGHETQLISGINRPC